MARRPNYGHQKREKEMKKQKKREAKDEKKRMKRDDAQGDEPSAGNDQDQDRDA